MSTSQVVQKAARRLIGFTTQPATRELQYGISVVVLYVLIALLGVRSFPSLYGDEYGSLFDSQHLLGNVHAIGYYSQLNIWLRFFDADGELRLLSLIWGLLGACLLDRWLHAEHLAVDIRRFVVVLFVINSFFWQYALQIRFYSFFLACSLCVYWRFAKWNDNSNRTNVALLIASLLLVVTSHFFGWIIVIMVGFVLLNLRRPRASWMLILMLLAGGVILFLAPNILQLIVSVVYRFTNPYVPVPQADPRGISLAMLAKIPLTFYFFSVGERLYPLQLWVVLPILVVVAACGIRAIGRLRNYPIIARFAIAGGAITAALYLVLDPLAPSSLQGASARYVIFCLPIFIAVLAVGAQSSRFLQACLVGSQVVALVFFLFPSDSYRALGRVAWSYGGQDLVDWPGYIRAVVNEPESTCLVVDGRSRAPVQRYAPAEVAIVDQLDACGSVHRIVLVSNDDRLDIVRWMDTVEQVLPAGYAPISNVTRFPVQATVYQRATTPALQVVPSRLDLPEQDLLFPIRSIKQGWTFSGFARLDDRRRTIVIDAPVGDASSVVTNYRSPNPLTLGTPVLSIRWIGTNGQTKEMIIRSGIETAAWNGSCTSCEPAASWLKRAALVGARGYSDAYREYTATVWASQITPPEWHVNRLVVTSLLPDGTVYLWGFYPE